MAAGRPQKVVAAILLALASLVACRPHGPGGGSVPEEHLAGSGLLERGIAAGEAHTYTVHLDDGDFLELVCEQAGVDITLTVDSGSEALEYDRPNRLHGPEEAPFMARVSALHRVVVRAIEGAGTYRLTYSAPGIPLPKDRQRDSTARQLAEAQRWRQLGDDADRLRAEAVFKAAADEALRSGETYAAAMAWREVGQTRVALGRTEAALDAYREARELVEPLDDPRQVVNLRNLESQLLLRLGKPNDALRSARLALALARQQGDLFGAAVALSNGALGRRRLGEAEAALRDEQSAVALWEEQGLPGHLALSLRNLGNGYLTLGREEDALDTFERARRIYRQRNDRAGEAATSAFIGQAMARRGETAAALAELQGALEVQQELGDSYGEATTLSRLATLQAEMGDLQAAEAGWERAIDLYSASGDLLRSAWVSTGREWWRLHGGSGEHTPWEEQHGAEVAASLALFEERGDLEGQAFALLVLARGRATEGSFDSLLAAEADAEAALELFESLRSSLAIAAFRRSLVDTRHAFYETLIAIRMQLHEMRPGAGYGARAFAVSERSRSRVLLDDLPGAAPLGLEPIQRDLFAPPAEEASLLAEFHLGDERSFLFLVGRDVFRVAVLPGRGLLEERARHLHDLLSRRDRALAETQERLVAADLGELLFGGARRELETARRLLIVADGALHYLPFSALVLDGERLIADHEVIHLPSASVLLHQRRVFAERKPAPRTLAMIADPLYSLEPVDAALGPAGLPSADLLRAAGDVGLESFLPLPGARREAEAALSLLPAEESLRALGPEASRETVLSGKLSQYRHIHFAAHGFSNLRRPELSGLALSLRDAAGAPQDGFLRAADVEGLELSADLVVLSACRTGLGKEERGAGLVGLPQSFFLAGARRVVVSLWSVGDASTAQLMERFYVGLLEEGWSPAKALHEAQRSLIDSGEDSPHAWAPFVLLGDWQ